MIKNLYKILVFIVVLSFFAFPVNAHVKPDDISLNDYSGVISDGVKSYVKANNTQLFSQTGAKIIFVSTDSSQGMSALEYTKNLYSSWNISGIGRNNSVFVVMCTDTNDYSIIQGKNIRRILNDSILYEMVSKDFEPYFANGDYDSAVMSLYNCLGKWYSNHYSGLSLNLDDNFGKYKTGLKTPDTEEKPSRLWLWIFVAVSFIMIILFFKIKRNLEFKIRQRERIQKRKTRKLDIDKIINS